MAATYIANHRLSEPNSSKKLSSLRWLLVVVALFLTFIPSAVLSLARNPKSSMMIPLGDNGKVSPGIVSIKSLSFSEEDVLIACTWIITMLGVSGLIRRNRVFGKCISALLISLAAVQTFLALYGVFSNNRIVTRSLNGAWQRAYENNKDLLKDIQYEFSCKGFASVTDRPVDIPESFSISCGAMMIQRFGPQLLRALMTTFISRLIQLLGILVLRYILQKLGPNDSDLEYTVVEEPNDFYYLADAAENLISSIYKYLTTHEVQVGGGGESGDESGHENGNEDEELSQLLFVCDFDN